MALAGVEERTKAMVTAAATGYCFSDSLAGGENQNIQSQVVSQFQPFDSNPHEIYGLNSGMEFIGFAPKNLPHHQSDPNWKEFFGKSHDQEGVVVVESSNSKVTINENQGTEFYHDQELEGHHESLMWNHDNNRVILDGHGDDQSLRSCVFPTNCEGNERPSQKLSLSLGGSSNTSRIGFQSFAQTDHYIRFSPSSSRSLSSIQQQQQIIENQMIQDGLMGKSGGNFHHQAGRFPIRSSKYLSPAQELLNEFCNLGTKQIDQPSKLKTKKSNQVQEDDENISTNSSSRMQSLYSLDLLELQKRKAKLLHMLEEVDRRYRNYCNQMKAVVSSFEAVAGNGAARVYSALASMAMSKHFRSLRDGIAGQIKATKKALGEKDIAAPGTTHGETPRLRLLDQTLRQQRAFQQMTTMETHLWRPQRGLPERAVSVLRAWLFEHFLHPYPSDVDKHILARQTGLSRSQVSNWFINARVRLWKPMVEEMYIEETKGQENMGSTEGANAFDDKNGRQNVENLDQQQEDQKPSHEQLVRIDSECLSSIINNPEKNDSRGSNKSLHDDHHHLHGFGRVSDSFGVMELDFSSYNHHNYATADGGGAGGGGGGGGVSLTLGLQQHGGGGVTLAFSPASQNSLFYSREHIDDCTPVQYSLLENEGQNLSYRNLMGAQLLHDLAG